MANGVKTGYADYIVEGPAASLSLVVGNPVLMGGSDGTNVVAIKVAADGSFAISGTVTADAVAQNSTTSGQSGNLVQGAVTTAAPTYTTGKTDPISLTIKGATRTSINQINDIDAQTGNGAAGTGTIRVAVANDSIPGTDETNNVIAVVQSPIIASTYAPLKDTSYGTVTKNTSKASAGLFMAVDVSNINATIRYFQIHNKASAPAGTNIPIASFPIPAGTANAPGVRTLDQSWFGSGDYCSLGVSWAISTTPDTFTDSATASDHIVNVRYF